MFARIANILGWAGVALVFAALAIKLRLPLQVKWSQGLAWGGLVCIVIYVLSQWREIAGAFSKRQARYGTLSLVSVITVFALLVGLNYVASRQNKRWDLTSSKEYELSDQTKRVLQTLKEPLRLVVFGRPDEFQRFRDQLQEYEQVSRQVTVEYVDMDKEVLRAREYQINSYGTVAAVVGKKIERATGAGEQELTTAIIRALQGQTRKAYFVSGHGERDPKSADERIGMSLIGGALGGDNLTVESVSLVQTPDVPADAAVAIVAGPTEDYLASEIEALRKYLNRGGKLFVMVDPVVGAEAKPLTNLIAFVKEWGFDVGDNVLIDPRNGLFVPSSLPYPGHPITERFNIFSAFSVARSVEPSATPPQNRNPQKVVETGSQSWAETDVAALTQENSQPSFDAAKDKQGPITVMAALSLPAPQPPAAAKPESGTAAEAAPPTPETRIVVSGDSDFGSNGSIRFLGNADLFLNTVNWLVQQENLISIRPKAPDDRRVTLTEEQQTLVWIFSIVLLPGLVLATGVYTWWRRRG
jgi:ABC-type uncharacterized transport system involved in gliding motility auxiliary subunit